MKVLVIGGTGVMGQYLVDLLKEKDCYIYVTSRPDRKNINIAMRVITITYSRDVVMAISNLVGNQLAYGEIFNIVGAKPIQWKYIKMLLYP